MRVRVAEPRGQLLAIERVTEGPLAYADPRKPKPKAKTAARDAKLTKQLAPGAELGAALAKLKNEVFYHWGTLAGETPSEHYYLLRPFDVLVVRCDGAERVLSYEILSNQDGAARMQRLIDELDAA